MDPKAQAGARCGNALASLLSVWNVALAVDVSVYLPSAVRDIRPIFR